MMKPEKNHKKDGIILTKWISVKDALPNDLDRIEFKVEHKDNTKETLQGQFQKSKYNSNNVFIINGGFWFTDTVIQWRPIKEFDDA